jgi:hypothetical protein
LVRRRIAHIRRLDAEIAAISDDIEVKLQDSGSKDVAGDALQHRLRTERFGQPLDADLNLRHLPPCEELRRWPATALGPELVLPAALSIRPTTS